MEQLDISYHQIFTDIKYADQESKKANGDTCTHTWFYRVRLYSPDHYYNPYLLKTEFGRSGDEDWNVTWSIMDDYRNNQAGAIRSTIKAIDCFEFPFEVKAGANA